MPWIIIRARGAQELQVSFRLREPLSRAHSVDPKDVIRTKAALRALGFYEPDDDGLTPIPDGDLFRGIESFQRKNKLHVDGEIQPNGPTEEKLQERLAKAPAGVRQRGEIMLAANADQGEGRSAPRRRGGPDGRARGESETDGRDPRDDQEAIAPAALPPLAYALAEFFAMSAAAAWALWQTLTKEEQATILERIGEGPSAGEEGKDHRDKCDARRDQDELTCENLPEDLKSRYFRDCMQRAIERWSQCYKQGFPPDDEPDPWGPADMEESFNRARGSGRRKPGKLKRKR